jgi:hypothetical protein
MSTKRRRHRAGHARTTLRKRAQKGFRGYPIATIAYYGPNDKFASKVAVGIVLQEDGEVACLERWFSEDTDVRLDSALNREVLDFIRSHNVQSVVITEGIIGCPHEEGIDYPVGEDCPECPYWAGRDRWTGKLVTGSGEEHSVEGVVMGVAWYRPGQWERLLEISDDRDELVATYEEWVKDAESTLQEMRKAGIYPEKVEIDVKDLLRWCNEHDRPVDGSARVEYTTEKLVQRRKDSGEQ